VRAHHSSGFLARLDGSVTPTAQSRLGQIGLGPARGNGPGTSRSPPSAASDPGCPETASNWVLKVIRDGRFELFALNGQARTLMVVMSEMVKLAVGHATRLGDRDQGQ
jgi:hypothetical protein